MSEFGDAYEALKARFLARCESDREKLAEHLAGAPLAPEALRLTLHRLRGAAGTFGFAELGRTAGAAEDACRDEAADLPARIGAVVEALAAERR